MLKRGEAGAGCADRTLQSLIQSAIVGSELYYPVGGGCEQLAERRDLGSQLSLFEDPFVPFPIHRLPDGLECMAELLHFTVQI